MRLFWDISGVVLFPALGSVHTLQPDFKGGDIVFTRAFFHSAHYVLADSSSIVTASQTGSTSILDCLLKASPMDLSLPSIGRRYKFCL